LSTSLPPVGPSGAIARVFQNSRLTPLLALLAILLGILVLVFTPKEEEPQIDVTLADILVALPGASAAEVENLISTPAEQVMSEIEGVKHVYSVSRQGQAVITVQFKSASAVRRHWFDSIIRCIPIRTGCLPTLAPARLWSSPEVSTTYRS
jgi:Cation/multidrug efflux pump